MWDTPSKQLFQKIMHPQLGLLSEYHLNVLIVAQSKQSIEVPIIWKYVETPDIPDESILHILRENGHAERICIEDIRACAGNDISLALMAANYYSMSGENAIISSKSWIVGVIICKKKNNNYPKYCGHFQ